MFLEILKAKLVKILSFHQPKQKSRIRKMELDSLTLLCALFPPGLILCASEGETSRDIKMACAHFFGHGVL